MTDYQAIELTGELLTGIDIIDDQHRILITLFNEANDQLKANMTAEFLGEITRDLLSYALYHFETEEELMQEVGYNEGSIEDATLHIQQHRRFSAKVVAIRNDIKAGQLISREDLLEFLNGWLVQHILNTDKRLAAFILAAQNTLNGE